MCLFALPVTAEAPLITGVVATRDSDTWRFDVTVAHPDTGWDHYADAWQVLDHAGGVLGERILAHPHETEQPFTRSLSGVTIPKGVTSVALRTRCSVDGWSSELTTVTLP